MTPGQVELLPAYSQLARVYDACLGIPSFRSTRRAFETLSRRYALTFRSAADLGCGTGLFACYLHDRWHVPVLAVDRSEPMLTRARRNCSRPGVRFLRQDIRCLRLPHAVDLVTAHFDTLNHILWPDELQRVFGRVFSCLRPGGHLLFDLVTDRMPRHGPRAFARRFRMTRATLTQQVRIDPRRRIIAIRIVQRSRASPVVSVEQHLERAYRVEDVARWLREAGFFIRALLDARTLRPADRESLRVALVARRPPTDP